MTVPVKVVVAGGAGGAEGTEVTTGGVGVGSELANPPEGRFCWVETAEPGAVWLL
jgi:hypothetical protein